MVSFTDRTSVNRYLAELRGRSSVEFTEAAPFPHLHLDQLQVEVPCKDRWLDEILESQDALLRKMDSVNGSTENSRRYLHHPGKMDPYTDMHQEECQGDAEIRCNTAHALDDPPSNSSEDMYDSGFNQGTVEESSPFDGWTIQIQESNERMSELTESEGEPEISSDSEDSVSVMSIGPSLHAESESEHGQLSPDAPSTPSPDTSSPGTLLADALCTSLVLETRFVMTTEDGISRSIQALQRREEHLMHCEDIGSHSYRTDARRVEHECYRMTHEMVHGGLLASIECDRRIGETSAMLQEDWLGQESLRSEQEMAAMQLEDERSCQRHEDGRLRREADMMIELDHQSNQLSVSRNEGLRLTRQDHDSCMWRMYTNAVTVRLQTAWRAHTCWRRYHQLRRVATCIQRIVRGSICRARFSERHGGLPKDLLLQRRENEIRNRQAFYERHQRLKSTIDSMMDDLREIDLAFFDAVEDTIGESGNSSVSHLPIADVQVLATVPSAGEDMTLEELEYIQNIASRLAAESRAYPLGAPVPHNPPGEQEIPIETQEWHITRGGRSEARRLHMLGRGNLWR